jgi:hypothetical protein
MSNVVYKRSWRELFRDGNRIWTKKEKEPKGKKRSEGGGLWKLTQPWKSIKVAFGDFLLMIFTAA